MTTEPQPILSEAQAWESFTDGLRKAGIVNPGKSNAELAWQVYDLARANPDHFDMGDWVSAPMARIESPSAVSLSSLTSDEACGTTACFAGWTIALRGYTMNVFGSVFSEVTGADPIGDVESVAAELLGLTPEAAGVLFFSLDDELERTVEMIFGPHPEVTP